jgi:hypothetical protein
VQVLMNLVCSSLKYTHSGSIKISASLTHSLAQVMVADTGAGIPSQQLQQALDPFELVSGNLLCVYVFLGGGGAEVCAPPGGGGSEPGRNAP